MDMRKYLFFIFAALLVSAGTARACEFCTLHNGLGQYNNQGDFFSVTYRTTSATTTVSGGTVQPSTGDRLDIATLQAYYQHAFSDKLKGSLVVPYISKTAKSFGAQVDSSSGLGDAVAMLRYTFMGNEEWFFAGIAGVKLPTGAKKTDTATNALSPDLVIGTGSTDPLVGFVYNRNFSNWNCSFDMLYKLSGTGYDGYQYGNVLNWGLNGYYRFNDNFNAGLGAISEITAADNDTNGTVTGTSGTVPDTGGTVIFAQPAVQYTNANFYAELAYQLPVYRNFTGTQLVVDNKLLVSLRYAF